MPCRSRHRRAFSLLEMVIVVAIIALLATIGFIGFGSVRRGQEVRNTRAAMEIARTMYNAFINAGRTGSNNLASDASGASASFYLRLAPQSWQFNKSVYPTSAESSEEIKYADFQQQPLGSVQFEYAKTIDYYNVPRREGDLKTGTPVPMNVPLKAVLSSKDNDASALGANWLPGSPPVTDGDRFQLYNTALTIRRMRNSPDAKAIWSTLRDSQIVNVTPQPLVPKSPKYDFLIDSWGHPLLFVPGSGIRGIQFGEGPPSGTPSYIKGDMASTPLSQQGLRSPDGRAFWMSAGPDGYYNTHDDNLYSFDNQ